MLSFGHDRGRTHYRINMLVIGEECMDEPWSLVFTMEGAEDPAKPVTVVCRGERLTQLQEQANALAEQGRDFVLDLAHVTGMDRVALGVVITLKVNVNKQDHTCVLRNPSARVMELLKVIGVAALFEVEQLGS
jgi:anti-anti-sigma factor